MSTATNDYEVPLMKEFLAWAESSGFELTNSAAIKQSMFSAFCAGHHLGLMDKNIRPVTLFPMRGKKLPKMGRGFASGMRVVPNSERLINPRTRSQVKRERETSYGCCEKYADRKACDCLETALPDPPGYHCGICNRPNCDNPGGKH